MTTQRQIIGATLGRMPDPGEARDGYARWLAELPADVLPPRQRALAAMRMAALVAAATEAGVGDVAGYRRALAALVRAEVDLDAAPDPLDDRIIGDGPAGAPAACN